MTCFLHLIFRNILVVFNKLQLLTFRFKVHPVPNYLVVNGCDPHQYCVLESDHQGSLQCTVNGIRPLIKLKWKTFYDRDTAAILFTNQQLTVKDNGDTFDVTLTSTYNLKDESRDRISIECTLMEEDEQLFELTTKLDLMFIEGNLLHDVFLE